MSLYVLDSEPGDIICCSVTGLVFLKTFTHTAIGLEANTSFQKKSS